MLPLHRAASNLENVRLALIGDALLHQLLVSINWVLGTTRGMTANISWNPWNCATETVDELEQLFRLLHLEHRPRALIFSFGAWYNANDVISQTSHAVRQLSTRSTEQVSELPRAAAAPSQPTIAPWTQASRPPAYTGKTWSNRPQAPPPAQTHTGRQRLLNALNYLKHTGMPDDEITKLAKEQLKELGAEEAVAAAKRAAVRAAVEANSKDSLQLSKQQAAKMSAWTSFDGAPRNQMCLEKELVHSRQFEAHLDLLTSYLDRERQRLPKVIIWIEPPSQHFRVSSQARNISDVFTTERCSSYDHRFDGWRHRATRIWQRLADAWSHDRTGPQVHIVQTRDIFEEAWHAHPEYDCTHYCPQTVAWNVYAERVLHRLALELAHAAR
jgi:hypothetical protein